jgi:mRNA interferase HigB
MNLFGTRLFDEFCRAHADAASQMSAWMAEIKAAGWKTPNDMRLRYPNASILDYGQVVFNIKGNDYRILTKIKIDTGDVLIRKVGTHAEYSKWKL